MTQIVKDKIEICKDKQTTSKPTKTWEDLKWSFLSLERYPKFQTLAIEYVEYKTHHNQEIDTEMLDEIIYLLIMLETSMVGLITTIKEKVIGSMTNVKIAKTLQNNFGLIATGLINPEIINELIQFILHLEPTKEDNSSTIATPTIHKESQNSKDNNRIIKQTKVKDNQLIVDKESVNNDVQPKTKRFKGLSSKITQPRIYQESGEREEHDDQTIFTLGLLDYSENV